MGQVEAPRYESLERRPGPGGVRDDRERELARESRGGSDDRLVRTPGGAGDDAGGAGHRGPPLAAHRAPDVEGPQRPHSPGETELDLPRVPGPPRVPDPPAF